MEKKVLLVEDDAFLRSLLSNRLKRDGIDVVTATTGDAAVEAIKSNNPDLVLLDIILPGKSGFEIMEEIKADPQVPNVPVIIISNLGQDSDIERGRELGVADYLVKADTPIDDLVSKIRDFLNTPN
ncbi:response regulator [Candidatus Wolfebacteria bacterium]|nr:response regulator [Candidatus Wolfebacteria bacterium]